MTDLPPSTEAALEGDTAIANRQGDTVVANPRTFKPKLPIVKLRAIFPFPFQ